MSVKFVVQKDVFDRAKLSASLRATYDGKIAVKFFLEGLISRLKKHCYIPTDFEPCLIYKRTCAIFIFFSICIDYFLLLNTQPIMIDYIFAFLLQQYDTKGFETPRKYLGW